jgi:hypothetical protein
MAQEKEEWEEIVAVRPPSRLVYMGQGQVFYTFFHVGTPDPLWPKKKKKAPQPASAPPARTEDWDAEIAASQAKED